MLEIEAYRLNVRLESPITISFHTWRFVENILVRLKYREFEGLGEAAPFKPITGDSPQELIGELQGLPELDLDPEQDTAEDLHLLLDPLVRSQTLRAAIDFAWHDLLGKIRGIPSYQLYAPRALPVPNTVTLFIKDSPLEVGRSAEALFCKYPDLSVVKIKLKGEDDLPRIEAIRRVAPAAMKFTLDANQGFSEPRTAVTVINNAVEVLGRVLLVEEPCAKGHLDKLKYVKENVRGTMIFADESAATIEDARRVVAAEAAHGINIKLQKAGGFWPGKLIASLCREAGLSVMVGSMLEGPLANMAGVHFAVSTPGVMLSDLDMDLELPEHALGRAAFTDGMRWPNEKPGFGVQYDEARMRSLIDAGEMVYEKIAARKPWRSGCRPEGTAPPFP